MHDKWITNLSDGRLVKFTHMEPASGGVFLLAQIAGNEGVYSIMVREIPAPMTRQEVESHFEHELSK